MESLFIILLCSVVPLVPLVTLSSEQFALVYLYINKTCFPCLFIYLCKATDSDFGENAEIIYSLMSTPASKRYIAIKGRVIPVTFSYNLSCIKIGAQDYLLRLSPALLLSENLLRVELVIRAANNANLRGNIVA